MTLKPESQQRLVTVSEAHSASDTLSERAATLIESDILTGTLEPGSRLGIHALSAQYAIGATPLREGISRLVARGLVRATGQRGFRVAAVSRADLEDITALRTVIETEALRRSMEAGDDEWEAGILAAQHRLSQKLLRDPDTMREGTPEFDALHKAFHRSLIAACGSERMLTLHDDLYLQAYRYRRVMLGRFEDPEFFLAIHRELADLVIARDADTAIAKLRGHLASTLEVVYGTD